MEQPKGLRVKLDFTFSVDDVEIPEMTYEVPDPVVPDAPKVSEVVFIKKSRHNKKADAKLF